MKKFLMVAVFLILSSQAYAWSNPSLTYQVGISSITTFIVNASSSAGTQMDAPTLAGRVVLEIQNLDSTFNLWCRPDSGVTTTNGRLVAPKNSWILSFADQFVKPGFPATTSAVHIYCVNDGATGTTKAAVTQGY